MPDGNQQLGRKVHAIVGPGVLAAGRIGGRITRFGTCRLRFESRVGVEISFVVLVVSNASR